MSARVDSVQVVSGAATPTLFIVMQITSPVPQHTTAIATGFSYSVRTTSPMKENILLGNGFVSPQLPLYTQPMTITFNLPLGFQGLNRIERIRDKDVHFGLEGRLDY